MISSMLIIGMAKLTQIAFSSTNSNGIAMQARQYADSEAELQKKVDYKDLAGAARSVIAGTDFQQEVIVSTESDYSDTIKQKQVTIKIYNGSESIPRASLNLIRYSVEQKVASGVPIGTIIAWISTQNPSDGIWLNCNGQSCAAYTELVAVLGKNTVPDLRGRFLEGNTVPGTVKEAGLPNITGKIVQNKPAIDNQFFTEDIREQSFEGAFCNLSGTYSVRAFTGPDGWGCLAPLDISFDASRSNSIYGASDTVQPAAVTVRYLIKAA